MQGTSITRVAQVGAVAAALALVGCSGSPDTSYTDRPSPTEATGGCDPNYSGCVPNVPYDLDCADIGHTVTVTGGDPHGLDRDGDGRGCE